ncbi:MAG: DUF134 domain-containing protein [Opitutales bacterium]|nr:DUF134 domain-containing protein [Opitutales bacterium]
MPRPICPRRISHRPPSGYYKPAGIPLSDLEEIVVAADELESIRLADAKGMYNQDAAKEMGVSRQTFERILKRAREKVAHALTQGIAIRLDSIEEQDSSTINSAPQGETWGHGRQCRNRHNGHRSFGNGPQA